MFSVKRLEAITKLLEEEGSVGINLLSERFQVSAKTIRQDLDKLEEMGVIERVHGGAILKGDNALLPIRRRKQQNLGEKARIATAALKYITEGETIILDGGSTTLELARLLGGSRVQVITDDLVIATELMPKENISLYVTGGKLRRNGVYTLLGRDAEQTIRKYNVNRLFLGTSALDFEEGLMVIVEEEAEMKKAMIESAKEVICLADYSKFHKLAFTSFASLQELDRLITDDRISREDREYLKEHGVEVEIV